MRSGEAANLASVEVEGGGGRMKSAELRIMEEGLLRALAAFGVIAPVAGAGSPSQASISRPVAEGHYVASEPGLVEHCVGLGDEVTQGHDRRASPSRLRVEAARRGRSLALFRAMCCARPNTSSCHPVSSSAISVRWCAPNLARDGGPHPV